MIVLKKVLYTYDHFYGIPEENGDFGGWNYSEHENMLQAIYDVQHNSIGSATRFIILEIKPDFAEIYYPDCKDVSESGIIYRIHRYFGKRNVYTCDNCSSNYEWFSECTYCSNESLCLNCGHCADCKIQEFDEEEV